MFNQGRMAKMLLGIEDNNNNWSISSTILYGSSYSCLFVESMILKYIIILFINSIFYLLINKKNGLFNTEESSSGRVLIILTVIYIIVDILSNI